MYCMGLIVLLVCHCVWHWFYRFVGMVLSFYLYLIVYCIGVFVLLVFDCVLHGYRCVDISMCIVLV